MILEDIKNLLESTGLPVAYRAFAENNAPELPFICYLSPGTNNFAADDTVYLEIDRITVELYTRYRDQESEDKVEAALSSFVWDKDINYIDSERCYQINYEIEV